MLAVLLRYFFKMLRKKFLDKEEDGACPFSLLPPASFDSAILPVIAIGGGIIAVRENPRERQ